ncbi:hypothetical protein CFP56_026303 [Quercus suber]|uniref:Uncharacterized protein n=1 Tax=Quercus suber TaxID=58331 RepID=A0AAW0K0X9_QUESU
MEEMMARMTALIIERLHHLEDAQGKKKKVVQEPQDEDFIRYTPNSSAPNYNTSEYCKYHQNHGHSTDKCTCLCHDIEGLIQSGKIPKPPINLPNIKSNPLPDYNVVPPPAWV